MYIASLIIIYYTVCIRKQEGMDIISAVRTQDLGAVEAAIARGEDVNSVDPLDNVSFY